MKWDSSADQHLLLAILSAHKVTVDHNRVAKIVGCTPRACEERIKKLRKLAKDCGYEAQPPTSPPPNKKRGKKVNKCGKDGGKQKCIDDADMILYRKGIVSDDIEVKMEDGMMIKREAIKREFGMGGYDGHEYGYGYGYGEALEPLIKQQKMEDSPPQFTRSPDIRALKNSSVPYANTAAGLEIPLGIPLEIAFEPLTPDCGEGGAYDYSRRAALPLKNEFQKVQKWYTPPQKTLPPRAGYPEYTSNAVEFIEISPASKRDPMVINDDDDDDHRDYSHAAREISSSGIL